jgi:hypothetical protein
MIGLETSWTLGQDPKVCLKQLKTVSHRELRESAAFDITEAFTLITILKVHKNDKHISDLSGNDEVDTYPILPILVMGKSVGHSEDT